MESLRDKIEFIIKELGISSMHFADEISVSRPIISHILKGRNKPSLEIVQRIYERFPKLGVNWMIDGVSVDLENIKFEKASNNFNVLDYTSRELNELSNSQDSPQIINSQAEFQDANKSVSQVIIFYTDGTCKVFKPSELGMG